jgi:hypothetical protein
MSNKIQIKRGVKANLPTLSVGEPALTTDTEQVFIGGSSNNIELAKKSDIQSSNLYDATCSYTSPTFTLTLSNNPTTLPNIYSVRVKMTDDWVSGSSIKIGTKTYSCINASFVNGEIVTINIDEVNAKAFFKSGGSASSVVYDTLPQQVDTFTAVAIDRVINLSWTIASTVYLTGYAIVYKTSDYPTNVQDGTIISGIPASSTSYQITGLTNGTTYFIRIFPYNTKAQYQTEYKVLMATPTATITLNSLSVGSKVMLNNGSDFPVTIIDKNHTGYPSNTITLLCDKVITNLSHGTGSTYGYSSIGITYFNNTFPSLVPSSVKSLVVQTTLTWANNWGTSSTMNAYYFLLSRYELEGAADQGTVTEGTTFSYFTDAVKRRSIGDGTYPGYGNFYWTRTPGINSGGANGNYYCVNQYGTTYQDSMGNAQGVRPAFNITQNNTLKIGSSPNANGYYVLV